uniref:Sorting nexin 29 n=1 Tax=Timema genevievae TaxID=629358 RepID=A0A7R9PIU7_TIMGE|nr:unnamed protein product [Timema genevievae]
MAVNMMSAVMPLSGTDALRSEGRQRLLSELLEAVKRCQIRFGGRTELATEADQHVAVLCALLEAALCHGLRSRPLVKSSSTLRQVTEIVSSSLHIGRGPNQEQPVFWHYVCEHLTRHEYERYLLLKNVWTDAGRGRAWLRSALNERSLERYLHCMLGNTAHLHTFYEDWSFLVDQEKSSMLPVMAAGLGSILFAIGIDNLELNRASGQNEPTMPNLTRSEPLITSTVADPDSGKRPGGQPRRRRKVPAQIISFDDDSNQHMESIDVISSSAPSTCLNSPAPGSQVEAAARLVLEGQQQIAGENLLGESTTSTAGSVTVLSNNGSRNELRGTKPLRNQTLTPVNNVNVGELIPVSLTDETHSEEDSLSVPSYSEDTETAAATHHLLQTNFRGQDTTDIIGEYTVVNGEETVTTLLVCKEQLQAEGRALKRLLVQSQENNSELGVELAETRRLNQERSLRSEARIQGLLRENELLKHQLRKYVAAVQMLKSDGSQAHEALASLEPRDTGLYPDYHHEAQEYEKKLIQVAEMHGELMEFNDRLHRLLQQKDAALHRLREELVDLRGPLPDDVITSDDDLSITSDYDTNSLCAAARALINIWIPSAFLTGGATDVHHVYQVYIRIRDDEWNIYRRYAQFYSLHKELKKQDTLISTFDFPPKKTIGNKDSRFVEERRRRLQHYLRCVMNHLVQTNLNLVSAPDKELLISLIPFFGEVCSGTEDRGRRKRPTSRNPFSRLSHSTDNNPGSSPQYTGL